MIEEQLTDLALIVGVGSNLSVSLFRLVSGGFRLASALNSRLNPEGAYSSRLAGCGGRDRCRVSPCSLTRASL